MSGRDHVAAVVDFHDAHPTGEHRFLDFSEAETSAESGVPA